jgi:hypothetical protein
MKAFFSWTVLALSAAACSTTNSTDGATSGIAIDDLASTYMNTVCSAYVNCPPSKSGAPSFATVEGCKAVLGAMSSDQGGGVDSLVAAVKSGKVKYDASSAQACLTAAANCAAFSGDQGEPAECKATFTGTVANAGACSQNEECISSYCQKTNGCGVCGTRGAEGAACTGNNSQCADGLVCASASNKCTKAPTPALGNSCNQSSECPTGAYCGGGATRTCLAQKDGDAVCDASDACKSGFNCQQSGKDQPKCVAVAKSGAPCATTGSDPMAACEAGNVCIADKAGAGTCKPVANLGGACGDSLECRGYDLTCVAGKCAILGAKGATCTPPTSQFKPLSCLPNLTCSGTTCADFPAIGQPCPEHQCAKGAMCDNGTCKAPPGDGENCSSECADGFNCSFDQTTGKGVCKAIVCK